VPGLSEPRDGKDSKEEYEALRATLVCCKTGYIIFNAMQIQEC